MAVAEGTRLGPYEIGAPLGAGGMGVVYRARDTKLHRDVAIKLLPDAFVSDAERVARFTREAQTLAALNHPHIAQIHGLEESSGMRALVMELVEGEDLAERIARGPIPVDDALPIARQVCEAIEAAHDLGIVHRDLKPGNIKVRADGTVKVLDFGLAKALWQDPSLTPHASRSAAAATVTRPRQGFGEAGSPTQVGVILGTPAYMAPEQARGKPVDRRADIWAFGCVLFEMLTGKPPFNPGETVSDAIAAILKSEPDWSRLPADTPRPILTLLRRCLQKDSQKRLPHIALARLEIDDGAVDEIAHRGIAPPAIGRRQWWTRALAIALVAAFAAILGGAATMALRPTPQPQLVTRYTISLRATSLGAAGQPVAISPDGTRIAYIASQQLYMRTMSELEPRIVPLTAASGQAAKPIGLPVFSPDNAWLAFYSDNSIKRVAVEGGAAISLCPAQNPTSMTWDPDGLLVAQRGGVVRCSPNGGPPEQLVTVHDQESVLGPQRLPGSGALLFTSTSGVGTVRWETASIVVQSSSGQRKTLVQTGSDARYLDTGHLVYAVGGVIYAVPFDAARLELTGAPVAVIEGVRRSRQPQTTVTTGLAHFTVSQTGTLLYVPGPSKATDVARAIALDDRSGTERRLAIPPGPYTHVRASRDGRMLVLGSEAAEDAGVWIYEMSGATAPRRLTFGARDRLPIWSPDGQRVAYQSNREGDLALFAQRVDGTGRVERLTRPAHREVHVPESWSPDAKHLLFSVIKDDRFSLAVLSVADGKTEPFGDARSVEWMGAVFSPDGKWVAYASSPVTGGQSAESRGVFIQPFPATGARYQAPRRGLDFHPVWSPDGKQLVYVPSAVSGELAVVAVRTTPGIAFETPRAVPATVTWDRRSGDSRVFDVLPGGRFVGLVSATAPDESADASEIRVVLGWFEELKRMAPAK